MKLNYNSTMGWIVGYFAIAPFYWYMGDYDLATIMAYCIVGILGAMFWGTLVEGMNKI